MVAHHFGTGVAVDQALVLEAVRRLAFEPLPARTPGPGEVLIRTLFSGVSAGTELSQYRGTSPFMSRSWDADQRLFRDGEPSWTFPVRNLGYEEVGRIEEVGSGVTRVRPGQLVFGAWNHRSIHVMREDEAAAKLIPEGADPRIGIFAHIGAVALNGVHDAASGSATSSWCSASACPGRSCCRRRAARAPRSSASTRSRAAGAWRCASAPTGCSTRPPARSPSW